MPEHRSINELVIMLLLWMTTGLSGCSIVPGGDSEASLALEAIATGGGRLADKTPTPTRHTIQYHIDNRFYIGDLYQSPQGSRAGIVLVPGVVASGKDDSRLVALAKTLARLQFAVLVPDIPTTREYKIRHSDVQHVADAARHMLTQRRLSPTGSVGMAGFSYGAAPVLLAALQPDINDRISFILSVGGYYQLESVVRFFTTGYFGIDHKQYMSPNPYIKWVFTLSNADLLERPEDQAALRAYAADVIGADDADHDDPPAGMADDARALYALLSNQDPGHVDRYLERLSPRIKMELDGINPAAHNLSGLKAQVILLHGKSDALIPYTESIALAKALPESRVSLYILDGLFHVDMQPQRQDLPKLLQAVEMLLAQRQSQQP